MGRRCAWLVLREGYRRNHRDDRQPDTLLQRIPIFLNFIAPPIFNNLVRSPKHEPVSNM
jgi:hypothetical protein